MLFYYLTTLSLYGDWGLLLLRLVLGAILLAHGLPKAKNLKGTAEWMGSVGFRPGMLWATVATAVEIVGGVMLILGFTTQVAAFVLMGQFAVIILWRIRRHEPLKSMEFDLLILAAVAVLLTVGSGSVSFDYYFSPLGF